MFLDIIIFLCHSRVSSLFHLLISNGLGLNVSLTFITIIHFGTRLPCILKNDAKCFFVYHGHE